MKRAVLVASFGTSMPDVIERCLVPIEAAIADEMQGWDVFRAFTSRIIVKKLEDSHGIHRPAQMLQILKEEGYQEIVIQPTHILPGIEYHEVKQTMEEFAAQNPAIRIVLAEPLFFHTQDYVDTVHAMASVFPKCGSNEKIVLFGHGTEHFSNACYFAFQHYLDQMGQNVRIGTVEGDPAFQDVLDTLKRENVETVHLIPLMLVAGDHVQNDMAGAEASSWESQLKKNGIHAKSSLTGMGENPNICALYARKTRRSVTE